MNSAANKISQIAMKIKEVAIAHNAEFALYNPNKFDGIVAQAVRIDGDRALVISGFADGSFKVGFVNAQFIAIAHCPSINC